MNNLQPYTGRVDPVEIAFARSLKIETDELDPLVKPLVGFKNISKAQIKMLTTALKIKKEYYPKGYYCFLHANEPKRAVLSWLTKKLIKQKYLRKDVKLFHFLRDPTQLVTETSIDELLKNEPDDWPQRTGLISADAFFLNTEPCESANSLCGFKASVFKISKKESDYKSLFQFIPAEHNREDFIKRFITIMEQFAASSECGNLYVYCIPQNKTKEMIYRSHYRGQPCGCRPAENNELILNAFQQDKKTDFLLPSTCFQYRILSFHLTPENGIRGFLLTPNRQAKKIAKLAIKELVSEMFFSTSIPKSLTLTDARHPQSQPRAPMRSQESTTSSETWTHVKASTILVASYLLFGLFVG